MIRDRESEIARRMSEDLIFQALGRAALKARARGLEAGLMIPVLGLEITVQEDESGDGIVVQYICCQEVIHDLAGSAALQLGLDLQALNEGERREIMGKILALLSTMLLSWRGIVMRTGPGDNLTFEMPVYKKDESWR